MDESNKNLGRFIVFWQIVQFRLYEEIMNEDWGRSQSSWLSPIQFVSKLRPPYIVERTNHFYWKFKLNPLKYVSEFSIVWLNVYFSAISIMAHILLSNKAKGVFFPKFWFMECHISTDEWNVRHLVLFPPPRFPETAELPPNVIRWPHLPQRNSLLHLTSWLLDLGNGYQALQPVHTILQRQERLNISERQMDKWMRHFFGRFIQ